MPTLHLVCGLPGSGKSALAKKLEQEHSALRLTADEWMARIGADGNDEEKRAAIEAIQWDLAQHVLRLGVDVVLEPGFWSRAERAAFRSRAAALGAQTKLHFLDVPREELLRRLAERNASLPPDTFHVELADLDAWIAQFEPPTRDELADEPAEMPP